MTKGYIDLHSHTCISDGKYTPRELVKLAVQQGITILAITDHNRMLSPEEIEELQAEAGGNLTIIRGAEVSTKFELSGKDVELHVVALFPDMYFDSTAIEAVLKKNVEYNRQIYIEGILEKLRAVDVHIGTYDDLVGKYGVYIGRPQVAAEIVACGYAETVNQAMDEYIGNFGKKRAFFENPQKENMPSLEEVIHAIHSSKGLPILAHLYYYKLNELDEHRLLKAFRSMAGISGGMEVDYRVYNKEQREKLGKMAKQYDLFPSSASDFHGLFDFDGLDNYFPADIYDEIIKRWEQFYGIVSQS